LRPKSQISGNHSPPKLLMQHSIESSFVGEYRRTDPSSTIGILRRRRDMQSGAVGALRCGEFLERVAPNPTKCKVGGSSKRRTVKFGLVRFRTTHSHLPIPPSQPRRPCTHRNSNPSSTANVSARMYVLHCPCAASIGLTSVPRSLVSQTPFACAERALNVGALQPDKPPEAAPPSR
jgi:hypothetical protein